MEAAPATLAPYDSLKDLNTDGSVPECRVGSPEQARAICNKMLLGNNKRFSRNALIKGMVDGNSPWPQDKLDSSNQQYRANFNTGEAESYLNAAKSAFYDLNSETETLATVRCDYGSDVDKRQEWSNILTEEFQKLQKKDDEFEFNTTLSQHDMVLYGAGPRVFDDLFDWRGRPMKFSQLLIPDDAASDTVRWVQCAYATEYRTDELYAFIRNPEAARAVGWDVAAVRQAIILAASNWMPPNLLGQQWEWNQQRLRNSDLYHGNNSRRVSIFRLFWREFSKPNEPKGRISEAWVVQNQQAATYLFKKVGRYASWNEVIHPMFYDNGDGTAHSVRGLGVKMYKALLAKMRLDNATVDSALARTAIMLKPSSAKEVNHPQHRGPYTILPPDSDFVQQAVGGVLDAPIAVSHELGNTLQVNLSQYRSRVDKPQGNPRTAYEIRTQVAQQSALNKTQIFKYYEQLDHWYAERYRRATNPNITDVMAGGELAMEFQKACRERGVPKMAMLRCTVSATRAMGQGNAQLRIETLRTMLTEIAGSLPEQGRQNLLDDYIASMAGGHSFVDRYNPKPKITHNDSEMLAWLQVAGMKAGIPAVVTGTQPHAIYAAIFAQAGGQAAMSLQQGGNPAEVAQFLDLIGRGMAAHLQFLARDPLHQREAKALEQAFKKLAQFHDQLIGKLQAQQQKMQEQQAKTDGVMTDLQLAQMETEADIKRKDMKAQHDIQLKNLKAGQAVAVTKQNLALNDAKTAAQIRIDNAKHQADLAQQKSEMAMAGAK